MGHVIAVIHVAAVSAVGVDGGPVTEDVGKEVAFTGFEDDVIDVVNHRDLVGAAQVVGDLRQADGGDEVIAAIDTSFIDKSEKKTFGLDRFLIPASAGHAVA